MDEIKYPTIQTPTGATYVRTVYYDFMPLADSGEEHSMYTVDKTCTYISIYGTQNSFDYSPPVRVQSLLYHPPEPSDQNHWVQVLHEDGSMEIVFNINKIIFFPVEDTVDGD